MVLDWVKSVPLIITSPFIERLSNSIGVWVREQVDAQVTTSVK